MTAACAVCAYATEHGAWPADAGTHCRTCHRSWTSLAWAHCPVCCETFTSNGVSDRHWPKGQHRDPADVDGLYLGPDGVWSTSADRDPGGRAERLAAGRRKAAAA